MFLAVLVFLSKEGFEMRFEYIHNLRGFAIFLVVLAHAVFVLPNLDSLSYLRYILINSTLLFMVIGGFLFSEIATRYTYRKYLLSKIKNVVLPYILISLPAVLLYILKIKTTHLWMDMDVFYQHNVLFQYLYLMITGAHLGPLWFIPMIIVFYLLFPAFKWVNQQSSFYVLLFLSLLVAIYIGRPMLNSNAFLSFLYFLPAYLFGIWLHKNQHTVIKMKSITELIVIGIITLCLLLYYLFGYSSHYDLILKLVLSFSLFCLFAKYFDNNNQLLNKLAQFSFFLFFIHGYFVGFIRQIINLSIIDNNAFIIITSLSFVLFCSILSCYLISRFVPSSKRFLFGTR